MLDWLLNFWGSEPEVIPADETPEAKTKREQRAVEREAKRQDKANKVRDRRAYRIEKIKALTAKFYAVATKRKWLVFLIGAVIAAFAYFKFVGF